MSELETLVMNWITKAEHDLKIGQGELRTDDPATDMVCYHMQQAVEKYLKGYLSSQGKSFRRTHDIAELIEQCRDVDAEFDLLYRHGADALTVFGVDVRYPEDFYMPTREEADRSVLVALQVRDFVSVKLRAAGLAA